MSLKFWYRWGLDWTMWLRQLNIPQKRIYYTDENSLIFQGYVVYRYPTLRQWRFTSVNFNQNLLVAPTFVKWRKLICTPDKFWFSWKALLFENILYLQGRLDEINVNKAVEFVKNCINFDGGFGSKPGSESHSGLIYCCVGLLSITGTTDRIFIF